MKNWKNKNNNLNNGITLIALVVTIIVLLILAGVSIMMVTGQNGILTQAQKAKKETKETQEEELIKLAYEATQMDILTGTTSENEIATKFEEELTNLGANPGGVDSNGDSIGVWIEDSRKLLQHIK